MAKKSIISGFEDLHIALKILILLVGGVVVLRIIRFVESRVASTLIYGLIGIIPIVGQVLAVLDIINECKHGHITNYIE